MTDPVDEAPTEEAAPCPSSSLVSSSTGPLDLLERVAVAEEDTAEDARGLRDRPNLSEVVVLSTCLRTELYAVVERFHEGVADLQEFLAERSGSTVEA